MLQTNLERKENLSHHDCIYKLKQSNYPGIRELPSKINKKPLYAVLEQLPLVLRCYVNIILRPCQGSTKHMLKIAKNKRPNDKAYDP